jgi:hypothetical protein
MTQPVVFIASLGHSGSTLLDLVLGGHPRLVGLGEVAAVLTSGSDGGPSFAGACSCGEDGPSCPLWSEVARRVDAEPDASLARRYQIVFETVTAVFGPDVMPVDSSKYLPWLRLLHEDVGVDLRALFLLKDVRNFMVSEVEAGIRKRGLGQRRRQLSPLGAFAYWHRHNRALERFLRDSRLPMFQLGYEELCLAAEPIVREICRFLGLAFEPAMLELRSSRSHVLRGNRMRQQPEKAALTYDHRWFMRRDWLLPAILCPRIMRYNRDHVYSNGIESMWSR